MTEKQANSIFNKKYPEGEIRRKHSTAAEGRYWVMFTKTGKVYRYSAKTYKELLEKLGVI